MAVVGSRTGQSTYAVQCVQYCTLEGRDRSALLAIVPIDIPDKTLQSLLDINDMSQVSRFEQRIHYQIIGSAESILLFVK